MLIPEEKHLSYFSPNITSQVFFTSQNYQMIISCHDCSMLPAQLPLNTHTRSNVHSQQYVSGVYDSWCAIAGLFPSACFPLWELLHHRWDSSSTCRWKSTALSESSFEFVPQVQLWLLCLYDSEETVLYFNLVIKNQIKWAVLQLGFKAVAFQLLFSSSI